ncbi:MAG TPA: NAD(P)-binding domain-containing protein, partial [Burkholderiales bacterium]|nr:NAD(P)-binding domain-containing protein [Burkholderiales bacterium]
MRLGFIGLGKMGAPMANRLAAAGCDLTVYNRTPGKMQPLLDLGAKGAESLREFRECDIVFTMLSDDEALEAVVFGSEGLLEILQKDALHVSCSTISVSL